MPMSDDPIDAVAKSISELCHSAIKKRLTQCFDVMGEEHRAALAAARAAEHARCVQLFRDQPGYGLHDMAADFLERNPPKGEV